MELQDYFNNKVHANDVIELQQFIFTYNDPRKTEKTAKDSSAPRDHVTTFRWPAVGPSSSLSPVSLYIFLTIAMEPLLGRGSIPRRSHIIG